jgi:integrase
MARNGAGFKIIDLWKEKGRSKTGRRWRAIAWCPREQKYRKRHFPDLMPDESSGFEKADTWARATSSRMRLHQDRASELELQAIADEYIRGLRDADKPPCDEHVEEIEKLVKRVIAAGITDVRAQDFALDVRGFIGSLRDAHPLRQPKEDEKDENGKPKLPRPLSHATKFRYLGHLMSITRWAVAWDYLDRDPLAKLKRTKPAGGKEVFTVEEISKLVAPGPEAYWVTIMTELYTGAEPAAGAHLRWEWLDWTGGLIWIRRHPAYRLKRNRERAIPMQPEWRAMMEERFPKAKRPDIGWVQGDPAIRSPFSVDGLDRKKCVKIFRKYCKDRNVEVGDRVPYSTRHTWVSVMLATTENPYDVMSWAGHESLKTTLTYGARRDDYKPAVKAWPRGTLKFLAAGAAVAAS